MSSAKTGAPDRPADCLQVCPFLGELVGGLFEIIHEPVKHVLETRHALLDHPDCSYTYKQKRRARIGKLLQPNSHYETCFECKNHIFKELHFVWFRTNCCELAGSLPPALQKLVSVYNKRAPAIKTPFVLTLFLVEKYNDFKSLDSWSVVQDMCKWAYIEKVQAQYTISEEAGGSNSAQ